MSKHVPVRTCVGCLEKKPQKDLIRIGQGRGAYLCSSEECFEKAMKRKAIARALRRTVSQEEINGFKKDFDSKVKSFTPAPGRDRDGPC